MQRRRSQGPLDFPADNCRHAPHRRLILFFTRGVSLKTWDRTGIFERETALYRQLVARGVEVAFVTYGDTSDLDYGPRLPGIHILCNRWRLPQRRYVFWLPILHGRHFFRSCVMKSNQTNGSDVALRASRFWRKPLIVRCGYMWSELTAHSGPDRQNESKLAERIENTVFHAAEKVVVTTQQMLDYVERHYRLPAGKTRVIPNYVLTDWFSPDGRPQAANRLLFVGRLNHEKNPLAIVDACAGLDVELVMAGDGPLRSTVTRRAERLRVPLTLLGQVPHEQLPDIYRRATSFILASPHEGHPKTLLEAMSCGLPVIGVDVPGIREIITHRENGFLCELSMDEIRLAIRTVLDDAPLRETMGRKARTYIVDRFSLERIIEKEMDLLNQMTHNGQHIERLMRGSQ